MPTPAARRSVRDRLDGLFTRRVVLPALRKPQLMRASQLEALGAPPPGAVVALGDSLTEQGLWQEWLPGDLVVNRGISGERSADVLRRVGTAVPDLSALAVDDPAAAEAAAPRGVLLLVGTNDLTAGVPVVEVAATVATLLAEVDRRVPGTPVVVQSVMPRTLARAAQVRALNVELRRVVDAAGPPVRWLDLWPALAGPDGALRAAFTLDGLHLTGAGYAAWAEVLRPVVASLPRRGTSAPVGSGHGPVDPRRGSA